MLKFHSIIYPKINVRIIFRIILTSIQKWFQIFSKPFHSFLVQNRCKFCYKIDSNLVPKSIPNLCTKSIQIWSQNRFQTSELVLKSIQNRFKIYSNLGPKSFQNQSKPGPKIDPKSVQIWSQNQSKIGPDLVSKSVQNRSRMRSL